MASNPGSIPAGGRDKISVVVDTRNQGGRTLTKSFTVTTNDPQHEQINLAVTGNVVPVVVIDPSFVRFAGFIGEQLSVTVNIKPQPGFPFKVKQVESSDSTIQVEVKPLGGNPEENGYALVATTVRDKTGVFRGLIKVHTDLKEKPLLQISVSGRIKAQEPEKPKPPNSK